MSDNNKKIPEKNWLEWTVFSLSLLLVCSLLGYLTYRSFTHQNSPPSLLTETKLQPGNKHENRYRVWVKNTGGQTAENVTVEVTLLQNGKKQSAKLDIPFSPMNSEREGWVVFEGKPQAGDSAIARVVSYKKP